MTRAVRFPLRLVLSYSTDAWGRFRRCVSVASSSSDEHRVGYYWCATRARRVMYVHGAYSVSHYDAQYLTSADWRTDGRSRRNRTDRACGVTHFPPRRRPSGPRETSTQWYGVLRRHNTRSVLNRVKTYRYNAITHLDGGARACDRRLLHDVRPGRDRSAGDLNDYRGSAERRRDLYSSVRIRHARGRVNYYCCRAVAAAAYDGDVGFTARREPRDHGDGGTPGWSIARVIDRRPPHTCPATRSSCCTVFYFFFFIFFGGTVRPFHANDNNNNNWTLVFIYLFFYFSRAQSDVFDRKSYFSSND